MDLEAGRLVGRLLNGRANNERYIGRWVVDIMSDIIRCLLPFGMYVLVLMTTGDQHCILEDNSVVIMDVIISAC